MRENEYIEFAIDRAEDEFWQSIADAFPLCLTGDLDPPVVCHLRDTMRAAVDLWIRTNLPKLDGCERFTPEVKK